MKNKLKPATPLAAIVAALLASMLIATPAFAKNDKDDDGKHGKDKHHKAQKHDKHDRDDKHERPAVRQIPVGGYFQEPQRGYVREYYTTQYKSGRCPPGLAKKNNGCMPPGQAKKWREGQRLNTTYYAVPQPLVTRLGPPPAGHRYVRVDSDILLITIGTMMVVDGMSGLMN